MFERFTDQSRRVLVLAQDEARVRNDDHLGTEHLLVGLILEGTGTASKVFNSLNISVEGVRQEIGVIVGEGHRATNPTPFTSHAKTALEHALNESMLLGHKCIGTEHILLGLIRGGEGVAIQVLEKLGTSPNKIRQLVIQNLAGYRNDGSEDT
ncbi:MAG: Clp protease N-terminal domain-containing protein [Specibacter sp.]